MAVLDGVSASAQDYLKSVWAMQEWSSEPVTPSALAARRGALRSTVSEAVRRLAAQGLVEHEPYGAIRLTEYGRACAVAVIRRHRLLETFLVDCLGYRWDEVHPEAEVLEHAISEQMLERLDGFLGHSRRDPHGDPIPGPDGAVDRPDAVLLTTCDVGNRAVVERISDEDPHWLRWFAGHGLGIGTSIEVVAVTASGQEILIGAAREPVPVTGEAAASIWVSLDS